MKPFKVYTVVAALLILGVAASLHLVWDEAETAGQFARSASAVSSIQKRIKRPVPRRLSIDNVDRVSADMRYLQKSDSIILLEEIYELGEQLLYEDRLALYEWIRITATDEETLYLKDEVLNQLERQETFPEEYAAQLSDMALDQSLDSDLRGYMLQHLRLNYGVFTDFQKAFVLDTCYEALKESGNDAGGTALINLTEFIKKGLNIDTELVREAAYNLAFEQYESVANRVTAIQCCVELGVTGIRGQLQEIIEDDTAPFGLKLSARAAFKELEGVY